ncbi:MAG TPA: phage tail tube protein [Terriglobales bacterium]|nr:phage tail tube protein [Terriglobales bacterium]
MSASNAFTGYGQQISISDGGSPPVGGVISEVQSVDYSGSKVDLADVTHSKSPNRRREYKATLIDSGEVSFTANFIPSDSSQAALRTLMDAAAPVTVVHTLPSTLGTRSFSAIIVSLDATTPFDKEAKLSCKLKVTGPITETFA